MIISVEKLKEYITTNEKDTVLETKIQALELLIREYTNNNFQKRNIRFKCRVEKQKLCLETDMLSIGDTIQISKSMYNDGVYTIKEISDGFIELNNKIFDEAEIVVTKIEYPVDIQMGVVNGPVSRFSTK